MSVSTLVPTLSKKALFPIALLAVTGRQLVFVRDAQSMNLNVSRRLLKEESSARAGVKEVDSLTSLD